jgi:bifunctional DNA-binding transcriptional regulator/antitoxin component of YhaV-PrlF toxin-antitoxin module
MTTSLQLSPEGRILIPQQMRAALGITTNSSLHARIVDGGLLLEPAHKQLSRFYGRFAKQRFSLAGANVSDELIAERQAEAKRESAAL